MAQASTRSPLNDLGLDSLKGELGSRYDAAVSAAQTPDVIRSEDPRYLWVSETKVQCGIAIGFTKHRIKDASSIDKCDDFSRRMKLTPPVAQFVPPLQQAPNCPTQPIVEVFFEWNLDAVTPESQTTLRQLVDARAACGWGPLVVTGHTDRSGANSYNDGLSIRRAANVATALESMGVARAEISAAGRGESQMKVETADGVREPANRRVEVVAQPRGQ
jgi:outer membrane protein OmpA-like peptidoglycan-associated protein